MKHTLFFSNIEIRAFDKQTMNSNARQFVARTPYARKVSLNLKQLLFTNYICFGLMKM